MSSVAELAYAKGFSIARSLGFLVFLAIGGNTLAGTIESNGSQQTAVATPGAHYDVADFHHFFIGTDYRELWTTPVEVPVLDLESFAGGLTPVARGGGMQTKGLRFVGADGRPYSFRGLDKSPLGVLPDYMHSTVIGDVTQDQTHAAFPTGYVVVPPLMDALGLLNASPKIVILPDSPLLGEFREGFAGLIGTIEEWPNEGPEGGPGFAGATDIVSTDQLFERLLEDGNQHVAAEEYLTARLLDVMIGDWDRHRGQWRWANLGPGDPPAWRPIPEDRDQAFVRYTGVVLEFARGVAPQLTKFEKDYASPLGPTWNGRDVDRRLLVGLGWATWDSVATSVQARLTDDVIIRAVGQLPTAHHELRGEFLIETLAWRRDHLPEFAREFYRLLAAEVDVNGSNAAELWQVEWLGKQGMHLTVIGPENETESGSFRIDRLFSAEDTGDVRLYLHGGDDTVVVGGERDCGINVRIICSAGIDRVDVKTDPSGVHVYDPRTSNPVEAGEIKVNSKPWAEPGQLSDEAPGLPEGGAEMALPFQDWGSRTLWGPVLDLNSDLGLVLGASWTRQNYGFRSHPYRNQQNASLAYSIGMNRFRARYGYRHAFANSSSLLTFQTMFSAIEYLNFYGFGNDTSKDFEANYYDNDAYLIDLAAGYAWERGDLALSCNWRFAAHKDQEGQQTLLTMEQPYGYGEFKYTGLTAGLDYDSRNSGTYATSGFHFMMDGAWYPGVLDGARTPFGHIGGTGKGYLRILGPLVGAARVGGRKLWGEFPYFEAATIGGGDTVRGYDQQRFAGDTSVFGNVELRRKLLDTYFLLPGELGVFLLGDAGRVYVNGDSPGGWHSSWGFGIWGGALKRISTMSLSLAFGEEGTSFYFNFGMEY